MNAGNFSIDSNGQTYIPTSISVEDSLVKMDMTSNEVSINIYDVIVLIVLAMISVAMILVTVISSIAESALTSAMSNHMQWSFSLDMGVVLVVLIVLILVYIFKYGAVLQQESDETL